MLSLEALVYILLNLVRVCLVITVCSEEKEMFSPEL